MFFLEKTFLKQVIGSLNNNNLQLLLNFVFGKVFELEQTISHIFKVTGTLHILSASAYNVNVVLASFEPITNKLKNRKSRFWVVLSIAFFYEIFSDKSLSILRALFSRLCYQLAKLNFRQFHFFRNLIFYLLVVLIVDAKLFTSLSLQLTLAACLALQAKAWLSFGKGKQSWQDELLFAPLVVQLFLAPILLFSFQEFSLVSLLVNLAIFWLIPILTKLGFIYFLFKVLGLVVQAQLLINLLIFSWLEPGLIMLVDIFLKILVFFANFSWLKLNFSLKYPWQLVIYYLVLAWLLTVIYQMKRQRYYSCAKFLFI